MLLGSYFKDLLQIKVNISLTLSEQTSEFLASGSTTARVVVRPVAAMTALVVVVTSLPALLHGLVVEVELIP